MVEEAAVVDEDEETGDFRFSFFKVSAVADALMVESLSLPGENVPLE